VSELPEGWAKARLRDLTESTAGWNPRLATGKTFRYVDIEAVDNAAQRIGTVREIPVAEAPSRARVQIKKGDVLFSLVRPYLKNIARVPEHLDDQVASTAFVALRPRPGVASSFLFYQLVQDTFVKSIPTYGNSPPAARDEEFLDLEVPVAPSQEQDRISAKVEELLSDLDAGVAALERARTNLKRYRAAVLRTAVEGRLTEKWRAVHADAEPAEKLLERILVERKKKWEEAQIKKYAEKGQALPKGWKDRYVEPAKPDVASLSTLPRTWCWASVGQVAEIQGGIQKQPNRAPKGNAFPYLRVGNVLRNRLDLSRMERFELTDEELQRLRLEPGDLLVVEGNGSRNEIGRSALWRGDIENCIHQNHIIRVRFRAGLPDYLNGYWNSPPGMARVAAQSASTSGLYTLSVGKVSEMPIPLPPLEEQREIVLEVDKCCSNLEHNVAALDLMEVRSSRLRQSILKRAFDGKLVPQDPKDEPASELLERIRLAGERKGAFPKKREMRSKNSV
jgi:type I restriction enzyme S subunit